jgi:hypothetical protein
VAINLDQLDARKPVQATGEARDLSVMPERRIDEARRAKKCAHIRAL